jgi:hypothetical protein
MTDTTFPVGATAADADHRAHLRLAVGQPMPLGYLNGARRRARPPARRRLSSARCRPKQADLQHGRRGRGRERGAAPLLERGRRAALGGRPKVQLCALPRTSIGFAKDGPSSGAGSHQGSRMSRWLMTSRFTVAPLACLLRALGLLPLSR